jgi:hypothetical protein
MNTLYYGDNLEILRKFVADESVEMHNKCQVTPLWSPSNT